MLKCFYRIRNAKQSFNVAFKGGTIVNRTRIKQVAVPNLSVCLNFKNFHTASVLRHKLFKETENIYAFDILQNIPLNNIDIYTPKSSNKTITATDEFNKLLDRDFRKATISDIVNTFKDALHYCIANNVNISDSRFDKLVDGLMDNVERLTSEDLYELLSTLIKYPTCESYTSHNFHDVWSALDDACYSKISDWSTDELFRFAELWYQLNLGKLSDYTFQMLDRLDRRAQCLSLSKEQIVHMFFYHNICRRKKISFELEYALEHYIDEMTVDELAIVAMGYFKSQSKIKPVKVFEAMCTKIIEEHATIHEISLAAIVKVR